MLAAFSTLLVASTLVFATPMQRRTAAVVPLPARSGHHSGNSKIFNPEAIRLERARIAQKYTSEKTRKNHAAVQDNKLSPVEHEVYDIQKRATSGHDPLVDVFDSIDEMYYGPLSVGTPAQATTVDFDTGSRHVNDLWLPTSSCSGCPGPLYSTTKSSTYKKSSTPFSVQYGDGSTASGNVAHDTVTVAGLTVTGQGLGIVTSESGNFLTSPSAGLLGLGFTGNAESGQTPFFINLCQKGALASQVFSFYMSRGGTTGSELCLGCTNSAKYTGSIQYYPLDPASTSGQNLWWNIKSAGFSYNGAKSSGAFSAIIDSGTTLIYLPTATAKAFYKTIPGAKAAPASVGDGLYVIPCSTMQSLKPITIKFGTSSYALDNDDFNLGPMEEGSSSCVAGIIGQDVGTSLAIVGDEFMKQWYSVFNYATKSVGFAKAI